MPAANVFISYETRTGLEYAREAKRVFTDAGYRAWMWEDDHTSSGYPHEDILTNLNECDFFFCICTQASDTSEGQRFEWNHALRLNKPPLILTFHPTQVPAVLKAHIWILVTPSTFGNECRKLAHDLDKYARLTTTNQRDAQIAAIRSQNSRLREDRLTECYDTIKRTYEAESSIVHLSRVIEEPTRSPSDFRVLSNSEARRLSQFNDDSYHWDNYCKQLARSIVLGETQYIFEQLQQLPPGDRLIAADSSQFDVVLDATRELIETGYNPDVLCAPISLYVPFVTEFGLRVDWTSSPAELSMVPGGPRLKLHWSSGLAPLDRFVVLDSSKTIWRVKLDPITDHRLTVMIGEPETPPESVVFLAETVAKYEILDPAAILSIPIEGEPEAPK